MLLAGAALWRSAAMFRAWRRSAAWPDRVTAELPAAWDHLRERCAKAMGVGGVPVYEAAGTPGPATTGSVSPVILLPEGFTEAYDEETLTAVLAHDMAHIRRHDYAVHLALRVRREGHWQNSQIQVRADQAPGVGTIPPSLRGCN